MENNEDIKIVEELLCQKYSERLLNTLSMAKEEDEVYILTINERQAIENLLSRLKTAERMNDVLAEQLGKNYTNCKFCKNFVGNSYMFACKEYSNKNQCIKEWARKKVEENV